MSASMRRARCHYRSFRIPNKPHLRVRHRTLYTRVVQLTSTKADDIARVLEDEIVGGAIAPGTVLRQEQLSERFDVSRTPVREALRRLAALGLVSFEPNRGVRVRSISPAELREAFLVRAELEALATEVATPRMTAADLAALDAAEQAFSALTLELREQARGGRGARLGALRRLDAGQLRVPRRHLPGRGDAARRAARERRAPHVHRRQGLERACRARRALREERPAAPRDPRGDRRRQRRLGARAWRASTCSPRGA